MAQVAIIAAQWVATAVIAALEGSIGLGASVLVADVAFAATLVAVTAAEVYAIGEISNLINPPPKIGGVGSPTDFKADPQAGVPYIIGRTGFAGNIVLADVAGDKNKYLTYVTVLSLGPVKSIGGFQANNVLTQFTSDSGEGAGVGQQTTNLSANVAAGATVIAVNATVGFLKGQAITVGGESATIDNIYPNSSQITLTSALASSHTASSSVVGPSTTSFYQKRMWWKSSLGGPSAAHITWTATGTDTPANHSGIPSSWGSSAKLSGLAHTLWTLEYDAAKYPSGTPKPVQVVEGVYVYDPRLDSTYSGGSGSCRSNDETTWVWSANPYLHALTWLIGRTSNGIRTMGVHAPISAIDVAAFVTGANVADSNGWVLGGGIYSTDSKWDVLKAMLIAGAGVPVKRGAMISCVVSAPQTSLDTITGADVVGEAVIPATASRRTRINGVWPRYREELQDWQIVPTLAPVTVSAYVTADGEQRTREVEYSLCQSASQASVLARYDIENAREFGPIILPCKPRWMGYRPGDCITINEPEYGLSNQKCVILNRSVEPSTMVTTLTLRTETDGKHAYALGQTGSPPSAPSLTSFDDTAVSTPANTDWTATGGAATSSTGAIPQIVVAGACTDPNVGAIIFEYAVNATTPVWQDWTDAKSTSTGTTINGLAPASAYLVGVRYRSVKGVVAADTARLVLGPVTTGGVAAGSAAAVPWPGVTDPSSTRPANNATVGATVGASTGNLTSDGSSGAPGTLRITDIYTQVGTAADFNLRGTLARLSSADWTSNVSGTGKPADNATVGADWAVNTTNRPSFATDVYSGGFIKSSYAKYGSGNLLSGLEPQEAGANVTETRTSNDFNLRGALARLSTVSLSGGTVSDASTVLAPSQNLLRNPTFKLGFQNWSVNGSFATFQSGQGILAFSSSTGTSTVSSVYQDIPVYASDYYSLSLRMGDDQAAGNTGGRVYIDWLNSSKVHISYGTIYAGLTGVGIVLRTFPGQLTPSGAAYARVVCDTYGRSGTAGAANCYWGEVKLERNSVCTPFRDDITYGSQYNDGTTLDGLKPGEVGANVTESRTANDFSGRGTLARLSSADWFSNVSSRPTWMTDTYGGTYVGPKADYINNQYTGAALSTYWPATTGADQTSGATANDFSGRGTLARLSTVSFSGGYISDASTVLAPGQNAVLNPGFKLVLQNWTSIGAASMYWTSSPQGSLAYATATGTGTAASQYQDILIYAGGAFSLSFRMGDDQAAGGSGPRCYIAWLDASHAPLGTYSAVTVCTTGNGIQQYYVPNQIAPSGAQYARLVCDTYGRSGTAGASACYWGAIKLEYGAVCTPYRDDQTYGAMYVSGTSMEGLKPGEIGANVTETRTANNFSGRGLLALLSSVGTANINSGAIGNEWHAEYNPLYTTGGSTYSVSEIHNLSGTGNPQEFCFINQTFSGNLLEIEIYFEAQQDVNFSLYLDATSSSNALTGGTNISGFMHGIAASSGTNAIRGQGNVASPLINFQGTSYRQYYTPSAGSHRISLGFNTNGNANTYVGRRWIHVRDYNAPVAKATSSTNFG